MRCVCDSVFELTGNEADEYVREHLLKLEVDAANWTVRYRCPTTGTAWVRDFPDSGEHGGGSPRLRQMDEAGKPVTKPSVDPFR